MPLDIRSIEHEVRRAPSIQKGVMILLQLLVTAIHEVEKNPDQLGKLLEKIQNNDDELARAIVANTRMAGEEVDPPADMRIPAQSTVNVPHPVEHPSGNRDSRPKALATPTHSDVNPPTAWPTEERRRASELAQIGTSEHQELGAWKGGEGPLNPDPRNNPADQYPSEGGAYQGFGAPDSKPGVLHDDGGSIGKAGEDWGPTGDSAREEAERQAAQQAQGDPGAEKKEEKNSFDFARFQKNLHKPSGQTPNELNQTADDLKTDLAPGKENPTT